METPRMRMFAGPNGSGKSVLKSYLPTPLLGVYLNADEIEADVRGCGFLDLRGFDIETTAEEILPFFLEAGLLKQYGRIAMAKKLSFENHRLHFPDGNMDSYLASVVAAFL